MRRQISFLTILFAATVFFVEAQEVEDCSFYGDVQDKTPRTASWSYELSRIKMS